MPSENGYTYTVTSNEAYITGYTGAGGNITIPSILGGYTVVSIGNQVFYQNASVTSVIIPNCVRTISTHAFANNNCRTIVIGNGVTLIDQYAFVNNHSLTTVTFTSTSSLKTIGNYAFEGCNVLSSIIIPRSVTTVGDRAFALCTSLISAIIEDGASFSIPYGIFYGCTSLASLTIGNGVTSIGIRAFNGCSSLTSITLPNSVTSIGDNAFTTCYKLSSIIIGSGVTIIGSGAFYNCSILATVRFLGLTKPTSIGTSWMFGVPITVRGYASSSSNFPLPGNVLPVKANPQTPGADYLMMGSIPGIPTNLTATPGDSRVYLNWVAASGVIFYYKVYRATSEFGTYTMISTSGVGYTDTGLTNGQIYWYKVTAMGDVESDPAGPVSAIPFTVTVTAVLVGDDIVFTFNYSINAPITRIDVYNINGRGSYTLIDTLFGKPTNYTDTPIITRKMFNSTRQYYKFIFNSVETVGSVVDATYTAIKYSRARGYGDYNLNYASAYSESRYSTYGSSYGPDLAGLILEASAWIDSQVSTQRDAAMGRGHVAFTIPNLSGKTINSLTLNMRASAAGASRTIYIVKNLTGAYSLALNNYSDASNGGTVYGTISYTGSTSVISKLLANVGANFPSSGGTFQLGLRMDMDYSNNPPNSAFSYTINLGGMIPTLSVNYTDFVDMAKYVVFVYPCPKPIENLEIEQYGDMLKLNWDYGYGTIVIGGEIYKKNDDDSYSLINEYTGEEINYNDLDLTYTDIASYRIRSKGNQDRYSYYTLGSANYIEVFPQIEFGSGGEAIRHTIYSMHNDTEAYRNYLSFNLWKTTETDATAPPNSHDPILLLKGDRTIETKDILPFIEDSYNFGEEIKRWKTVYSNNTIAIASRSANLALWGGK